VIVDRLVHRLAGELTDQGVLSDPAWRAAFFRVPRHKFIPDWIWTEPEGSDKYTAVCRTTDPDVWWQAVYRDDYVVTQVDDGRHPAPGVVGDLSTSSASMPSLVFRMLAELALSDGMRVLEIGTGTGYNAALLCARLGSEQVVTVEVDPELARQGEEAIASMGLLPTVVTGDGADGYAPGAPYDRVLATCAVQRVPYAWVEQIKPGGQILTPWGTAYHNGGLLSLEKDKDGTASGVFVGSSSFMWLRSQRVPFGRVRDFIHDEEKADRTTTNLDPCSVTDDDAAEFAIGLRVPNCQPRVFWADDVSGEFTLWLLDPDSDSWASVDYEPDATAYAVEQYGTRRLWDEVEAAHCWWVEADQPGRERFGITVTAEGQHVRLDDRRLAPIRRIPSASA